MKLLVTSKYNKLKLRLPLHLMLVPGIILVLVFCYYPMIGIVSAFQKFNPMKGFFGSEFIGLTNFIYIAKMPDTLEVLWNTVFIAFMKIVAGILVPVAFSLLMNEVTHKFIKRSIQTFIYLPHFLSWVILSGILIDVLSPSSGIVNAFLGVIGIEPIYFLANEGLFPYVLVVTDVWKEFGFGTIIYLAAITSIDPSLYEASVVDGANRWKQTLYVTIPGILPIIILMTTLSLGNVLNAGFEQVFNLYSPVVYKSGDIIDTFVYRIGLIDAQYGVATAVGLFKSVISFVFILASYKLAYRFADYKVF